MAYFSRLFQEPQRPKPSAQIEALPEDADEEITVPDESPQKGPVKQSAWAASASSNRHRTAHYMMFHMRSARSGALSSSSDSQSIERCYPRALLPGLRTYDDFVACQPMQSEEIISVDDEIISVPCDVATLPVMPQLEVCRPQFNALTLIHAYDTVCVYSVWRLIHD